MDPTEEPLILQGPKSPSEWDAYFDLRWRILRQPWSQPRGSERDSEDNSAFHLLLMDAAGKDLACGRLHLPAPGEAQIRYMAVEEQARGCGYGSRDSPRADGEVVFIRTYNKIAWITTYARLVSYLFS